MSRPKVVTVCDKGSSPTGHRGASAQQPRRDLVCDIVLKRSRCGSSRVEDDLNEWRCHALPTTTQFIHHATHEDLYSVACQLRDHLGQDHEGMPHTTLQRIYDIARFRKSHTRINGPTASTPQSVLKY